MTIAELQSGLATKLTKTDLDGYATQTWSQNQIKMTADGINGTVSSVKNTVNGHTTSINDLKADSSSFKSQFTTVNNTLGKQTTDIGNLQATSKELTTGFNTLTSDNKTNKNDISELKQTSSELSSTMETVQTQVQNSAVGTNLIIQSDFKNGYLDPDTGGVRSTSIDFNSDDYIATNGATVFTFSSPDYVFKGNGAHDRIAMYDSNKNYLGYQSLASPTQTLSKSNVAYIRFSINSGDEGNTTGNSSDWLSNHRYKLEKGSLSTDWCLNPADTATQSQITQLSGEITQKVSNGDFSTYKTQTADLIASKVSKDTYDALAGTVSENTTLSKQNQNELVNKADSQTVNLLTKRVSTAENTLTQTATKTALKQTKTDVDNINKTVQTNTSNISAQAGKIGGLLSTTKNVSDQLTTLSGKFNLSSKQLATTMSKVDGMSIGGVNLLPNSDFESSITTEIGTVNSGSYSFSKDYHYHGVQSLKISLASNISSADSGIILKIPNPQTSTEYTTTGWLYSEAARTIVISNYSNNWTSLGRTNVQVPEKTWTKFVVHFKTTTITNNAGTAIFVNGVTGNDVQPFYLDCVQIEEGNIATDWSPAPEDQATVTALTQVKQTAEGAKALATNNQGDITSLQATAKGIQTSVSNAATKDQLTILSSQLTNQITDLKSSTNSQFTQTASDMDLLVKKGDVVNQFNIDAGGALLQTVGGNTKIVLSAPNVIVDSANPMQIQNANIVGTLTGKTFEAGTITATTKVIGSDIEAALVHSKDNSFRLDGATGDIVSPSIHAADNSWGISNAGKIHGTSITASVMDISGDGKGPNFDAVNVTPDTTQGIYSRYKYSVNSGYDVSKFGRKLYKNGYLVINGDTFLNRTIGDWSADGGGKYVYDTMYEAHTIKMRAYNYTGSNVQTDDPSSTEGSISSRLDIQPSAITMGRDWSVGNPNILIDGDGLLKVGTIAINGHHSMGTTDGSDMYFMKMNKDATDVSGTSIPIHAARYYTANMGISGGHVINSYDGGDVYLEDKWGSGGNTVSLHVKKLYNSSLLSLKTDITTIDPNDALETIANTDFRSYRFKTDDPSEPKSVSPILDDENQIPIYNTPNIFKSADGKSRNDGNILGYTALSVQALYAKIKDLTTRLQKLEGAQ